MVYSRIFYFLKDGDPISVPIKLVRFIIAGSNTTFTFYGSLFLPRTNYSVPLLKNWIDYEPAFLSPVVCNTWKAILKQDIPQRISFHLSDCINARLI